MARIHVTNIGGGGDVDVLGSVVSCVNVPLNVGVHSGEELVRLRVQGRGQGRGGVSR